MPAETQVFIKTLKDMNNETGTAVADRQSKNALNTKLSYNEGRAKLICKNLLTRHFHGHSADLSHIGRLITDDQIIKRMGVSNVDITSVKKMKKIKVTISTVEGPKHLVFEPSSNGEGSYYF